MDYEYVPDPIERAEASIENWYYDNLQPDGRLKCSCGRLFKLEDGVDSGPSPWAIPMCPTCGEENERP